MKDNFEEKAKDIYDNPPDFPVDYDGWETLSNQLDEIPPAAIPPKTKGWVWIPVLLALLGLSAFSALNYSQNQTLKKQLDEIILNQNIIIQKDTILEKHITVVYDTIYIIKNQNRDHANKSKLTNKGITSYQSSSKFLTNKLFSGNNKIGSSFYDTNENVLLRKNRGGYSLLQAGLQNKNKGMVLSEKADDELKSSQTTETRYIPVTRVNSISMSLLSTEATYKLPPLSYFANVTRKKRFKEVIAPMLPTQFTLGLSYGMGEDFSLDLHDLSQSNYIVGLDAEIGFGKNVSMALGADLRFQNFKAEEDDHELNLDGFPIPNPQDPTDRLKEIYGDVDYLEIPIGFKYAFLANRKIRPFLSFGLTSRKITKSKIKYEYQSNSGDYELNQENFLNREFAIKNAWGTLGAQYQFGKSWSLFLESSYQFDLEKSNTSQLEAVKLWKGSGGILYQF